MPVTRVCDGRTPEQVDVDRRWLSNARVAQCSLELKIKPCREWLEANCDPADTILYVGIDWTEMERIPGITRGWAPWTVRMPLCEPPYIDKRQIEAELRRREIEPPLLNRLGFPHNNCGGACVRGGQAQWAHLLRTFPDRFAAKEAHEERMRAQLGADVSILKDRTGGATRPLPLRLFRSRVEIQNAAQAGPGKPVRRPGLGRLRLPDLVRGGGRVTAPITVAGLCEGYGGIFLALQRLLPVQHTWYAENDPAASAVLAAHWPDAPNHDDITRIDWSSTTQPEILTAGWPCQPFSGAGKQLGTADDRHLWPYVADAVTTLRPQLFIGENVQGLLTIEHGQVFGKVLADLDVAGYRVSWTTVGACKVGACHHRHRVFIAAARVDVRAPYSDPIAHRNGDAWLPAQTPLFGDHEALKWPQAGYTAGGAAWELPADVCGAAGTMLPTPTATPYGNNQSPARAPPSGRRSTASSGCYPPPARLTLALLAGGAARASGRRCHRCCSPRRRRRAASVCCSRRRAPPTPPRQARTSAARPATGPSRPRRSTSVSAATRVRWPGRRARLVSPCRTRPGPAVTARPACRRRLRNGWWACRPDGSPTTSAATRPSLGPVTVWCRSRLRTPCRRCARSRPQPAS
ncbi:hypothetical protein JCM9534A_59700 [Catenuloplanes indicus JCM 9534]